LNTYCNLQISLEIVQFFSLLHSIRLHYALDKPVMSSTTPSFGKTSSVKGKRYPCLPLLAPSVMVSRSATAFSRPLALAASASLCQITPSRHGRTFRQSRGATAGSGLRLCVKDDLLHACVLVTTQTDNSRIRWSASQECQHFLSADIRPYSKKLLGTSAALLQEVTLPTNFMLRNVSTTLTSDFDQVCGCYKEADDHPRLSCTTRNGSSSKPSPRKCRMIQVRHV
jgi:hypothetical protein